MSITVEATYENGMLKLFQPLPLNEHDKVRVTVEELPALAASQPLSLAAWFSSIEAETGLVDGPPDYAAEHDHYLYGAAKRDAAHGS